MKEGPKVLEHAVSQAVNRSSGLPVKSVFAPRSNRCAEIIVGIQPLLSHTPCRAERQHWRRRGPRHFSASALLPPRGL